MIRQLGLLLSLAAHSVALSVSRVRTDVDWGSTEQQARLESLKPVIIVHMPKAGSTFINVIAEHPGICQNVPPFSQEFIDQLGDFAGVDYRQRYMNEEHCPGGLAGDYFQTGFQHEGVGGWPKRAYTGHLTTMLRQPEARMLSAWNFQASFLPNWPDERFHWNDERGPVPATFKEYAEAMQGGMVKILTRRDPAPGGPDDKSLPHPTMKETQEAVRMLNEDFGFVGITEHWDLSVCLFHAMYGGECVSEEFEPLRANKNHTGDSIDDLNGWRDVYDGALYEEGLTIFNKNLELYNVNEANCPSSCRSPTL
mmetsp:Transcript_24808/g.50783  ORF Transcript_24808/g.50783 Transcript_24808/m.50783 type:complete len:310 (-) Transcript_24808:90-1019(-)